MVTSLPRNIQLKLEHTLGQWRRWQCDPPLPAAPEMVTVMTRGLSNYSVLVEVGRPSVGRPSVGRPSVGRHPTGERPAEQRYVVRIDGINPAANGINRQAEWRILQSAHSAGLAPQPRYFNPELGSMVCDYLPADEQQPQAIAEVAGLLRGIHQLPPRHHRLELAERIMGYEKQLEHRGKPPIGELAQYRDQLPELLERINAQGQPVVLCHNDLLQANRIYSGNRLWAIDWEYSAMGNPWFDLAVTATGDSFDGAGRLEFLETYLQRPASADDHLQLQLHSCVYRYLEILWYQAVEHPDLDEQALQSRLALLGASLEEL
jgi:thiamine kinase